MIALNILEFSLLLRMHAFLNQVVTRSTSKTEWVLELLRQGLNWFISRRGFMLSRIEDITVSRSQKVTVFAHLFCSGTVLTWRCQGPGIFLYIDSMRTNYQKRIYSRLHCFTDTVCVLPEHGISWFILIWHMPVIFNPDTFCWLFRPSFCQS